jgi:hypothetical protein
MVLLEAQEVAQAMAQIPEVRQQPIKGLAVVQALQRGRLTMRVVAVVAREGLGEMQAGQPLELVA